MRYMIVMLTTAFFMLSTQVFADSNTPSFSPAQTTEIQKIVQQYLIDNPQILLAMAQKLQQQQMTQDKQLVAQAKKTIPTLGGELFQNPGSPVAGNTNGAVTMVEFFDYQCSHCREMANIVSTLMQKNANLKVVYKEFPIFGSTSAFAAKAALAAGMQGKFQSMHDALMQAPLPFTEQSILALAKDQGLDVSKLQKDMASPQVLAELKQNDNLAKQLQLQGTPAFIVSPSNSSNTNQATLVPGAASFATLQQLITQVG